MRRHMNQHPQFRSGSLVLVPKAIFHFMPQLQTNLHRAINGTFFGPAIARRMGSLLSPEQDAFMVFDCARKD